MNNKPFRPQVSLSQNDSWREDWRIMGQEGYLHGKHLEHRRFNRKMSFYDFDQCDFCYKCFDNDKNRPLRAFYVPDERVWICENCYNDFSSYFQWSVEEIDD